jgi:TolB protein
MNVIRLPVLLCLFALHAPAAEGLTLPGWMQFWKSEAVGKTPLLMPKKIHVGDFSGGTGGSARQALVDELTASRDFMLTSEKPDYTVTGSSIGGRVSGRLVDAAGKELMERTYAAPGLDENTKALADDIILAITGKPGLATSRIVFVSDKSGSKQVYLCDPEGRDVLQVTHHSHGAVSPSLSADGSAVAYTSYRNGFPIVQWLDLGQGWERTVTETPGTSFGWRW